MSHPWMPFYVGDYLGKTQRLTTAEHGAYLLLIMEYWQSGGLPTDDGQLSRICRLTLKEWQRMRATIAAFFQPNWQHHRIDEELASADSIVSAKSEAGKAGAAKRWQTNKHADSSRMAAASHTQSQTDAPSPSPPPKEDISPPSGARADKPKDDLDLTEAIAVFNQAAEPAGWPVVQRLTAQRATALRTRLAECGGIEGWQAAIARAKASAFLCGDNDRGWKADFDFICKSKNFTKLMEGGYDRSTGNGSAVKTRAHDAIFGALARAAQQGAGVVEREADPDVGSDRLAIAEVGDPAAFRDLEIPTFLRRDQPAGDRH